MTTFITILIFILLYGIVSRLLGPFVLSITGLPGAFLGGKCISTKEPRFILSVAVSVILHSYIYFVYMIYLIGWTKVRIQSHDLVNFIVWFFCACACLGPIQQIYHLAKKDNTEFPPVYVNPQIKSLLITEVLSVLAFFAFIFLPSAIDPLWSWVLKIGYPLD